VKRISLAVLLDHNRRWVKEGAATRAVVEPPSPERLKAVRDLVSAAAGLNTERGDQFILESLPFETLEEIDPTGAPAPATPAPASPLPPWLQKIGGEKVLVWGGAGAGALLLIVIGVAVMMARRRRSGVTVTAAAQLPAARAAGAVAGGAPAARQLEQETEAYAELPAARPKKSDIVAGRLRETIKKDPGSSAQILRSWLTADEE
ncbi:MAG TPA: flagellar M-ring protein FliF C-terminal domain-containing protein, partial [Bryobacteraceae bacterium]|nr:flagellar M-ring protein FliF C-terminal domain-containing protein [Bryobacteraceae bacterium]